MDFDWPRGLEKGVIGAITGVIAYLLLSFFTQTVDSRNSDKARYTKRILSRGATATLSIVFAAIVAVSLLNWAPPSSSGWGVFRDDAGRFVVTAPGAPEKSEQTVQVPSVGPVVLHWFRFRFVLDSDQAVFAVAYADYPVELRDFEASLDGARNGAASNLQGRVSKERRISLAGHPGRDLTIEVPKGNVIYRARIYLVGQRQYQIQAVTSKRRAGAGEVEQFLNSFALTAD